MDKKTKGAWLIHHANKLQEVTNPCDHENILLAGKTGILLSAISANSETTVNNDRLVALAKAANITIKTELPALLKELKKQKLIDVSSGGVAVLGVTTESALQHTSNIFDSFEPSANEMASIDLAEHASETPILFNDVSGKLADTYNLTNSDLEKLLFDSEQIGFVDIERIDRKNKLLFNGNLFRRDTAQKIKKVLDSLMSADQEKLNEFTETLKLRACVSEQDAKRILGDALYEKVTAVGFFDINVVSNSTENVGFLTLPSAFSKYSNSMVEDVFDLAKAFVSSITYGITKSPHHRGKIQLVDALLSALVRGESVGPVPAIAEDYKVLELKGVVEVTLGKKKGRTGPMLRLLKKEVGELALQAIQQGDVSEHSLSALPTAAVTTYEGPECNREKVRRKQVEMHPQRTNDILSALRKGAGL
ncbi:MAG: hypothetical protein HQL96_01540 [Magnetococcales bacterium]|nr:hypothetical protein [Magnetococcales bacterium]